MNLFCWLLLLVLISGLNLFSSSNFFQGEFDHPYTICMLVISAAFLTSLFECLGILSNLISKYLLNMSTVTFKLNLEG